DLGKTAHSGNAHLTGTSLQKDGHVSFCVNGSVVKISTADAPSVLKDSVPLSAGKFDVNLQQPLATNQTLLAIVSDDDGSPLADAQFTVRPEIPAETTPLIMTDLVPGVTRIQIKGTPTLANMGYEVHVAPCAAPPSIEGPVDIKWSAANRFWEPTDANGTATFDLNQALFGGQQIQFCEDIVDVTDPASAPLNTAHSATAHVNDPLDLGRVRYWFTTGV